LANELTPFLSTIIDLENSAELTSILLIDLIIHDYGLLIYLIDAVKIILSFTKNIKIYFNVQICSEKESKEAVQ